MTLKVFSSPLGWGRQRCGAGALVVAVSQEQRGQREKQEVGS